MMIESTIGYLGVVLGFLLCGAYCVRYRNRKGHIKLDVFLKIITMSFGIAAGGVIAMSLLIRAINNKPMVIDIYLMTGSVAVIHESVKGLRLLFGKKKEQRICIDK